MLATAKAAEPVWHLFPLFIARGDREELRDHLKVSQVQSGVHYPRIIPDQAVLRCTEVFKIAIEPANARHLASAELSLPVHPFLEDNEIATIISACQGFQN